MKLSHSRVSTWNQCHRKYYYSYELGLAEGEYSNLAPEFSSQLVHKPLPRWYLSGGQPMSDSEWQVLWEEYLTKVGPTGELDSFYTLNLAKRIYEQYTSQYADDFETYRVVSAENLVEKPIGDVLWVMKPDVVLAEGAGAEVTPMDFKMTASNWNTTTPDFERQFVGQLYALGATKLLRAGIHVDKRSKKQTITCLREEIEPPDHAFEEFAIEVQHTAFEIDSAKTIGVWPKHSESCYAYGRECPFMKLCTNGQAIRDKLIVDWPHKLVDD